MSEYQPVESIHLDTANYAKAITVINELAKIDNRSAHEAARILIVEEGRKKIDRLKANQEHQ